MRTSRTTSLREPTGSDPIPETTFAYFRTRNRHRLYSLVIREFKRSGISQADLARRLGKGTDIVCRWLRSPGNWTADTVSDLLFATSGAEPDYAGVKYPLADAAAATASDSSTVDSSATTIVSEASQPTTSNENPKKATVVPLIRPGTDRPPVEVEPYVTTVEEQEAA